jgi:hypothetical protein
MIQVIKHYERGTVFECQWTDDIFYEVVILGHFEKETEFTEGGVRQTMLVHQFIHTANSSMPCQYREGSVRLYRLTDRRLSEQEIEKIIDRTALVEKITSKYSKRKLSQEVKNA